MIDFLKWLVKFILGTDKKQVFKRLMVLIVTFGIIGMLMTNIGYKDGRWYWKPIDISIKKEIGG